MESIHFFVSDEIRLPSVFVRIIIDYYISLC